MNPDALSTLCTHPDDHQRIVWDRGLVDPEIGRFRLAKDTCADCGQVLEVAVLLEREVRQQRKRKDGQSAYGKDVFTASDGDRTVVAHPNTVQAHGHRV